MEVFSVFLPEEGGAVLVLGGQCLTTQPYPPDGPDWFIGSLLTFVVDQSLHSGETLKTWRTAAPRGQEVTSEPPGCPSGSKPHLDLLSGLQTHSSRIVEDE